MRKICRGLWPQACRALYDNLGKDENLAIEVDKLRNLQGCEDENRHLRDLNNKLEGKLQRLHERSMKESRELRSRVRELETRLNAASSPSRSSSSTRENDEKWAEKLKLLEDEMHEIKQSCRRKVMEKNDEIRRLRNLVKQKKKKK